ncbi:MAG: outer membrane beta-barrel protein [Bacteroidota bacterium]|nr:outer membrane beta-barrel protein [Bacteroidota bacterium]
MFKFFLSASAFIFFSSSTFAQGYAVSGNVYGTKDGLSISRAKIYMYSVPDSVLFKQIQIDTSGKFVFEEITNGTYYIKISIVGYYDYYKRVNVLSSSTYLGNIQLKSDLDVMKTVTIISKQKAVTQKGDTVEFNAGSFKVNPDATAEDLVTKMPGISTVDGKIQAQGEEVKKVLVDGKPFFGDDPNAALKNLPAETVDKIQVFDQQSDQNLFSGFNDGNTSKTMNIITKSNMRNGKFGKIYAGYGDQGTYKVGLNYNILKGDRRISLLAQSNNINEQNFAAEDLLGAMGQSGGGGRGGPGGQGGMRGQMPSGGGGSNNNFSVSSKNGITTTNAVGLNYADKWGKKIDVTASYFLNHTSTVTDQDLIKHFVFGSAQQYIENSSNTTKNLNHRINIRLNWFIDSSNSMLFTPKLSIQDHSGANQLAGHTDNDMQQLNRTINNSTSKTNGLNLSTGILYRHKFKLYGRTLSIESNPGHNNSNGNTSLNSGNTYYNTTNNSDSINQQGNSAKQGWSIGNTVNYTEPIGKKSMLQFTYANSFNQTTNNKKTDNYSSVTNAYDDVVPTLSNKFKNTYYTNSVGLGYRYANTKSQLIVSSNFQTSNLASVQKFPRDTTFTRNFNNILPSVVWRYNINTKKSLRVVCRTNTNQPSVDQLQNVVNNSNPLQLSMGNPSLKQTFEQNMFVRYSYTNPTKSTSFFALVSGNTVQNYIANSTQIATADTTFNGVSLRRGSQLTMPVNVDGYYSLRSFITFGRPLKFIKSNINFNANISFSHTPGLLNNLINYANSPNYGAGLVISSNISKDIDFTIGSNGSYTSVNNTLNKASNTSYYNQTSTFKFNLIVWKHWVFNTDMTHQYYKGLSSGYNQSFVLWNAAVGYKFLKDNMGEFRLRVFDILKQNTSISRTITETYTQDVQTSLLQRYVMLTFTYNFRQFKKLGR